MNRIEAMTRTKAVIAETQRHCEDPSSAAAMNSHMRAWVGDILVKELERAMKGLVLFRKDEDGNPGEAMEDACRKLAARLHRRAIKLSTKGLGTDANDEAVCIFYFFPQIIASLERIARVFDQTVRTIDPDDDEAEAS